LFVWWWCGGGEEGEEEEGTRYKYEYTKEKVLTQPKTKEILFFLGSSTNPYPLPPSLLSTPTFNGNNNKNTSSMSIPSSPPPPFSDPSAPSDQPGSEDLEMIQPGPGQRARKPPKPRIPIPKIDAELLLSEKGLPWVKEQFGKRFRSRGKGYEVMTQFEIGREGRKKVEEGKRRWCKDRRMEKHNGRGRERRH